MKLFTLSLYSLKPFMDNVTVYMETVYNSSNSTNSTRNLDKIGKSRLCMLCCLQTLSACPKLPHLFIFDVAFHHWAVAQITDLWHVTPFTEYNLLITFNKRDVSKSLL